MVRIIVLLLIIVVIAGLVWMLRRQGGNPGRSARRLRHDSARGGRSAETTARPGGVEKLRDNPMFWGVEMGQPGCEAAQALLGQQFPFDEVPQLPLEDCSSANCTCQFKGLKDRRTLVRRQQEDRREALRFDKDRPERRSRKDRRRGNAWTDHDY
jgi:hypothetical protein